MELEGDRAMRDRASGNGREKTSCLKRANLTANFNYLTVENEIEELMAATADDYKRVLCLL